jgi:hypothetical protein
VTGQPYKATAPGAAEDQTAPTTIYDAAGGAGTAEPWVKIQDGGACDSSGRAMADAWPGDGASTSGGWEQT